MSARTGPLALVLALSVSCHGKKGPDPTPPPPASTGAVQGPRIDVPGRATLEQLIAAADLRVEARRSLVERMEPLLERHRASLVRQLGEEPLPVLAEVARTTEGRSMVLLQAARGEPRPLLWLLSGAGDLEWAKEHPIGGVKPGVREPAVAPGPEGRVSLSWCNGATSSVALRQWTSDGAAFADYEVMHFDSCEALSFLYWPRRGWLVGVASPTGLALQLVSESGELLWGRDGMSLPWTWSGAATASLGLDTPDTMLLFRLGQSGGPGSPAYLFASRYDPGGHPLWPGPVSVKKLAGKPNPRGRIVLSPGKDGAIRAQVPQEEGGPGGVEGPVDVASDGSVTLPAGAPY